MTEPTTVTYSIAEVLKRIEDKLDSNQKETNDKFKEVNDKFKEVNQKLEAIVQDLTQIKVSVATVTEKVAGMDKRLEKVEGTQKNQVWALIVLLFGAIATAGARLFFTGNP